MEELLVVSESAITITNWRLRQSNQSSQAFNFKTVTMFSKILGCIQHGFIITKERKQEA
jgi:hypothetical protein